jgi:long-chain fatty acid transport protein
MTFAFTRSSVGRAAAASLFVLGGAPAFGAGFQLNENSVSDLGTAFAGSAATADDATTVWSNAAGMSRLTQRQMSGALHLVIPSMKLGNQASLPAASQALGGEGGDAGGVNYVPNFYAVLPMASDWTLGFGLNAPWGLVSEYEQGWLGRFQAIRSAIQTMNGTAAVSWKPSSSWALGFGVNLQRMQAEFTNQVNYSAALLGAAAAAGIAPGSPRFNAIAQSTAGLESAATVEGGDNTWGWNLGVLWEIDAASRFGAQYRSGVKYHLRGDAKFVNPTPAVPPALAGVVGALAAAVNSKALNDTSITADVELPAIVNLSYFRSLDRNWDVMAGAQWTGWSSIQSLTFVRVDGTTLQSTPENFKDVWKLAVGGQYRPGGEWLFRGGLAYDQSPVQDAYRTARLPDADRTWLTAGAQYRPNPKLSFDFGGAYVWVKSAPINDSGHPSNIPAYGLINGNYNSNTVILSAQVNALF